MKTRDHPHLRIMGGDDGSASVTLPQDARVVTTLYDLVGALQSVVEDERQVAPLAAAVLRRGRARFVRHVA